MQDRFKFRYNYNNKIYDVSAIDFARLKGEIVSLDKMETLMCKLDLNNLIQCTGLKDKNGKLIYEGDIVQWSCADEKNIGIVVWNDVYMQFYIEYDSLLYSFFPKRIVEKVEIVGNIYENPELLEKKNG